MPIDQSRFEALWLRCTSAATNASAAFKQLSQHYREPHRHYHTWDHIAHCLSQLDQIRHLPNCPDGLELSIWYHDVIYELSAKDNEQRSAELFMSHSDKIMADDLRQQVYDLIMVTVHPSHPLTLDQCLMVDIDLSSFCLPWADFLHDSANVRAEYPTMDDHSFNTGQAKFLNSLAAREWFFCSDFYRQHHEQTARDNISRLLRSLQEPDTIE